MNSRARVQATTKNLFSPGIEYLASKLASFPCQVSWQIYLLARLGWTRFLWRVILASVNNLNKLPWHVFLGTVLDCIAVTLFFDKWFVTEELVEIVPYREDHKNSSRKTSFVSNTWFLRPQPASQKCQEQIEQKKLLLWKPNVEWVSFRSSIIYQKQISQE